MQDRGGMARFSKYIRKINRLLSNYEAKAHNFLPFSAALDPLVSCLNKHESTVMGSEQSKGDFDVANSVGSLLDSNDRIQLIKLSNYNNSTDPIPFRKRSFREGKAGSRQLYENESDLESNEAMEPLEISPRVD